MKKTLRIALMAVLSVFAMGATAQTTLWEEDWQSSEAGKLVNEVTNANAVYTLSTSNDKPFTKIYTNTNDATNLELLLPQTSRGESWTATITLNGKSGDMTLTYSYNKNQINVTSSTTGVTVSDVDKSGAKINVPAGTETLALTFSNPMGSNARLDDIKLVTGASQEEDLPEVANIAALKALGTGKKAILTLTDAQILFTSGSDMYLQDATGALDIYGCGLSYTAGQKLNGKAKVEYTVYNNLPEITSFTNVTVTATDGTATPQEIGVEDITAAKICQYVKVSGTVHVTQEGTKTNYYLADEEDNEILIYRKWSSIEESDLSGITEGAQATITGVVVYSGTTLAIGVAKAEYEGSDDVETVANIAALKALAPTAKVRLTLTDAVVTFVNGKDMYVSDASGSIDFYGCNLTYTAGNKLNGTIDVTEYKVYNKLPEITKVTNNTLTATEGEATPQEVAITAVNDDMACALVKVSGKVTTTTETITPTTGDPYERTNYFLNDDSSNTLQFYRKWTKLDGTDLSGIKDGDQATVTGIVVYSGGNVAIGVTAVESVASGINGINAETESNAPIYNLAGQRVEKAVKGIYIQNGKKFVVK